MASFIPKRLVLGIVFNILTGTAFAVQSPEAMLLQDRYHDMEASLSHSPLQRPLQISSQESDEHLSGDIFATVDFDMATLNKSASSSERWCEVMLLLSNSQACQVTPGKKDHLQVSISRSKTSGLAGAISTEFELQVHSDAVDYLDTAMIATEGPMGTRDISLRLQAIPIGATRSFLHLHYAYSTHWLGRMAMKSYLQTAGRSKVGFTQESVASASASYIGGARGVIERNTMRYFLGLDCALALNAQAASSRFSSMAQCWYAQVEKYPTQLHEMQRTEYLNLKSVRSQ